MKKLFTNVLLTLAGLYVIVCALLYFFQEKLLFHPQKLDKNYTFTFFNPFEEVKVCTPDGETLHGLLFKADSTKGLVFYLHGNAGSLANWGEVAKTYTNMQYDVFIYDYRGYGKSSGEIESEQQLYDDSQILYGHLQDRYSHDETVILGYSVGTGIAAKLASENAAKLLILQAPYYSMTDMVRNKFPIVPIFLLRYKLATSDHLKNCDMPVVIFHGDHDGVIYHGSSVKLQKEFKSGDTLITLAGQGHNGITENQEYRNILQTILK